MVKRKRDADVRWNIEVEDPTCWAVAAIPLLFRCFHVGLPGQSQKRKMLAWNSGSTSATRWVTCLLALLGLVGMTDNYLSNLPDNLWTRGRSWTVIGWGHTHSVASLPTKTQQECMPLRLLNLTSQTKWISCSLILVLTEPSCNTETLRCLDHLHLFKLKSFYCKLMFFFICILDEEHFNAVYNWIKNISSVSYEDTFIGFHVQWNCKVQI